MELEFPPVKSKDIVSVLDECIKRDDVNKLLTFLTMLSAYTPDSQMNISFNAPSSSGKTFIPTQIARLFPVVDLQILAHTSPTSFIHDQGVYDKESCEYRVNFCNRIIIFLDQPQQRLLQTLRPVLSHDQSEIVSKVTDRSEKNGLRTKTVRFFNFPVVIFCTADLAMDEQEATRFFLLSPEIDTQKIREGVHARFKNQLVSGEAGLDNDLPPTWAVLRSRIEAIKSSGIEEIVLPEHLDAEKRFISQHSILLPRHQRDAGRFISLVKTLALLNWWHRERNGNTLVVDDSDIDEAVGIWASISPTQDLGLPPYLYDIYEKVIYPLSQNATEGSRKSIRGVDRAEICRQYYTVYSQPMPDAKLRQQILPMLAAAGLITEVDDPSDRRKKMIQTVASLPANNSELQYGAATPETESGGSDA